MTYFWASRSPTPGSVRLWGYAHDLVAAIGLLTVLPLPRPNEKSDAFARATLFFPPVGLLIGAGLASLSWLSADRWPGWMAAVLLVAAWEGLCGSATLLAWRGGRDHRALAAAAAIGLLIKVVCLAQPSGSRPAALLFAPMLGRWCMVVLAVGARHGRAPGQKFNAAITFREFAVTSVFSRAVVFSVAEAVGVLIAVCVATAALVGRLVSHHWGNGVEWRGLIVWAHGIEALVIGLFSLL
jgi:cobalamin synthase